MADRTTKKTPPPAAVRTSEQGRRREEGRSTNTVIERGRSRASRAVEELRNLVNASSLSQAEIERRIGFSKGYLSQLFAGNLDLKVWHVLAVLDILDTAPSDFFEHVDPRNPGAELLARFAAASPPRPATRKALHELYDELSPERLAHLRRQTEAALERAIFDLAAGAPSNG